MATSKTMEQHIAVFGESGSGKTVLLSSFFGATQEPSFQKRSLFDVIAIPASKGTRLLQKYYRMKNRAEVPAATRFRAESHEFAVKLKNVPAPKQKRAAPITALRIVWHDYPGEWFEQDDVSGAEEEQRRAEAFRSLLGSDVAFVLVDGQKLKDHAGEEERYLKPLFLGFRNGLLGLRDDLMPDGKPLVQFPRIWLMALSKADLHPEMTASAFKELLIEKAAEEMGLFEESISGMIAGQEALSVGEDYVLLSSAKFAPGHIELTQRIGLELILPLAAMLPFQRHAKWAQRLDLPTKVADELLSNADAVTSVLVGAALLGTKVKLPGPLGIIQRVVGLAASAGVLKEAASLAGDSLRQANTRARTKNQDMAAILTGFTMDLEQGEKDDVLIRSKQ